MTSAEDSVVVISDPGLAGVTVSWNAVTSTIAVEWSTNPMPAVNKKLESWLRDVLASREYTVYVGTPDCGGCVATSDVIKGGALSYKTVLDSDNATVYTGQPISAVVRVC